MHVSSTVTAISFWLATLLPVLYVPMFIIGLDSIVKFVTFLVLLTINVIALVVGHDYRTKTT